MMKQNKAVLCIFAILTITIISIFLFKSHIKESKTVTNLNENISIEDFENALNSNSIELIGETFISDDSKEEYNNWLMNISSGSEADLFIKNAEFEIIKVNADKSPSIEVKIIYPDLLKIIKSIADENGGVPPKDIAIEKIKEILISNDVPMKTTNVTVPVTTTSDQLYGLSWNAETVNLLSGNLLGTLSELENYHNELLNQKMENFLNGVEKGK